MKAHEAADLLRRYGNACVEGDSDEAAVLAAGLIERLASAPDVRPGFIAAEPPRGRETSTALTEVRTVYQRAVTAREALAGPTECVYGDDGRPALAGDGSWPRVEDPDAAAMRRALDVVIATLSPWRRTGRPTKARA